jgi:acyl-CoA reductase-like NAD-dependent aldehyde dehydrogenase
MVVVDGVVLLSWTIQLSIERNFCAVDSALIMGNTVIFKPAKIVLLISPLFRL